MSKVLFSIIVVSILLVVIIPYFGPQIRFRIDKDTVKAKVELTRLSIRTLGSGTNFGSYRDYLEHVKNSCPDLYDNRSISFPLRKALSAGKFCYQVSFKNIDDPASVPMIWFNDSDLQGMTPTLFLNGDVLMVKLSSLPKDNIGYMFDQ